MAQIGADPRLVEEHLRAFINAFIVPPSRSRWVHCLIEKPEKARDRMHSFYRHLDIRYRQPINGGDRDDLDATFGEAPGIYFDMELNSGLMTPADARDRTSWGYDALLSLEPGKLVLCFDHDGNVWVCRR